MRRGSESRGLAGEPGRRAAVVKLGGSLVGDPALRAWVSALGDAGPVVIVPGGGPFADAVRAAQPRLGFDDPTAHHLALLAMEQMGRALVGLDRRLRAAPTGSALARALREGAVPVWLPAAMALRRPEIPASWEVTSDSLAAWLAGALGADRLILVKAARASAFQAEGRGPAVRDLADGAATGLVDPRFAEFLARSSARAWWAGAGDHLGAGAALRAGGGVGVELASAEPPP